MKTQNVVLFTLFAASSFVLACNGDNNNNDAGGNDSGNDVVVNNDSGGDAGMQLPTLKTQIDRMGRPAINTALNHVFDPSASAAGTAKDTYNADKNVAGWGAAYEAQFAGNLAILDALDLTDAGGGCGNQAAYGADTDAGAGLHYKPLASLAADDQLYVDTSKTTCGQYLGVELNAINLLPNTDCGGRGISGTGGYDVMNFTYAAAAGNALAPVVPVTDGPTTPVTAKTNGTTFPYLSPPQ